MKDIHIVCKLRPAFFSMVLFPVDNMRMLHSISALLRGKPPEPLDFVPREHLCYTNHCL